MIHVISSYSSPATPPPSPMGPLPRQRAYALLDPFLDLQEPDDGNLFSADQLVAQVDEESRPILAEALYFSIDGLDDEDKMEIFRTIATIPGSLRTDYVKNWQQLLTCSMDGHKRLLLLFAITRIPIDEVPSVLAEAQRSISPDSRLDPEEMANLLQRIANARRITPQFFV